MKYDKDKSWVRGILRSADIMNTMNGGMSQPAVKMQKKDDHYLITASVPGVDHSLLKVEVVDKHVLLYHTLQMGSGDDQALNIPRVLASFPISSDIDYEKITANLQDERLNVKLPFNELSNGYYRSIRVSK